VFGRRFPISLVISRSREFSGTGKSHPRFCSGRNSEMGWVPYAGRAPLHNERVRGVGSSAGCLR